MPKFRKKPVVIEAEKLTESNAVELRSWINKHYSEAPYATVAMCGVKGVEIRIPTLEGEMAASVGDWVIKGVNGEFYPCKPDIFEKTYDLVD